MTCGGCKASVEKSLNKVEEILNVDVNLENGETKIKMSELISLAELQNSLDEKFSISEQQIIEAPFIEKKSTLHQLKPLFLILFYILVASIFMNYNNWKFQEAMMDYMGLFFIVFSFFKMLDIKGFAKSFPMYDPIAKQIPFYAKIYPFIETALGIFFLTRFQIELSLILTIVILGITTIGVTKVLLAKKTIKCACLGTVLNLPMTKATFIENAIMLVMSTMLLTQFI